MAVPAPDWLWPTVWEVSLSFPAYDSAEELFDCSTAPSFPGLRTRTEMLLLVGWYCVEVALD